MTYNIRVKPILIATQAAKIRKEMQSGELSLTDYCNKSAELAYLERLLDYPGHHA